MPKLRPGDHHARENRLSWEIRVNGNYYFYPTSSDAFPNNDLIDPDPGNSGNFNLGDSTVGSPYWRTEAGEFENSDSPYGTFDMAGNVWEWNESLL